MTPEHSSIGDSCVIIVERIGQMEVGKGIPIQLVNEFIGNVVTCFDAN